MTELARQKIIIFGCGNVAWHLAKHFQSLKKYSVTIHNHSENPLLGQFRSKLKCRVEPDFSNINGKADFYIIAVSDAHIAGVAKKISITNPNAILLHTSGSVKIKSLGNRVPGTGVFYPLQTFTRTAAVDWNEVPVIIEGSDKATELGIKNLASSFTKQVKVFSYKERLSLHLAAVLVNNFTNALFVAADHFLAQSAKETDFKMLLPLIRRTVSKVSEMPPLQAQTGPAKRNDADVIKKHLALISDPDLKKTYKQLTKLIAKQQKHAEL